ncbi:hypothetical protein [Micrococcus porci]|uniref:hypothetical protein n=1 Tax=Micrococcus porci TaxID=2856555 RepID=UPI003CE75967
MQSDFFLKAIVRPISTDTGDKALENHSDPVVKTSLGGRRKAISRPVAYSVAVICAVALGFVYCKYFHKTDYDKRVAAYSESQLMPLLVAQLHDDSDDHSVKNLNIGDWASFESDPGYSWVVVDVGEDSISIRIHAEYDNDVIDDRPYKANACFAVPKNSEESTFKSKACPLFR